MRNLSFEIYSFQGAVRIFCVGSLRLENITALVKPLTKKYHVKEIYLFGSYARGEADENSDLDFLVFGGEGFKLTSILALGEELREVLKKKVDIFEIREVRAC